MKINKIKMSWFRGASSDTVLLTDSQSVLIYGDNGAGKSSFVDALELIVNKGKIKHLTNEYTGTNQKKGKLNTHKPPGIKAKVGIEFDDNKTVNCEITENGKTTLSGDGKATIDTWEYWRTILRQDEVASFIKGPKGEKYSTLLPLFGLDHLETAAKNLAGLKRAIISSSDLEILRRENYSQISTLITNPQTFQLYFEEAEKIIEHHSIKDLPDTKQPWKRYKRAMECVQSKISQTEMPNSHVESIHRFAKSGIHDFLEQVVENKNAYDQLSTSFVEHKIQIIEASLELSNKYMGENIFPCPSCGQAVKLNAFKNHISQERKQLAGAIESRQTLLFSLNKLHEELTALKQISLNDNIFEWIRDNSPDEIGNILYHIRKLDLSSFLEIDSIDELRALIDGDITELINYFINLGIQTPIETQSIFTDRQLLENAYSIAKERHIKDIDSVVNYLEDIESDIRKEIRTKADKVTDEISQDIQKLWNYLYPETPIDSVRLYLHDWKDKAIDVKLNFFGDEQNSPRIALSEGYRNSLGLCLFFAIAKQSTDVKHPIILDDVIVSLDNVNSMRVASLVESEFSDRQVFIFTHDENWYEELCNHLDSQKWKFVKLLPWVNPETGIRVA